MWLFASRPWKGPVDVGWNLAVDDTPERRGGGGIHLFGQPSDGGRDIGPSSGYFTAASPTWTDSSSIRMNANGRSSNCAWRNA